MPHIVRINVKCQKFDTESYVFPGAHSPTLTLTHTHIHTRNTIDGSWFIGKLTTNKEWNGQRGILLAFHLKKIIWLLTFACVRCAPPSNTRRLPFDARIPIKSGTTFFINVRESHKHELIAFLAVVDMLAPYYFSFYAEREKPRILFFIRSGIIYI